MPTLELTDKKIAQGKIALLDLLKDTIIRDRSVKVRDYSAQVSSTQSDIIPVPLKAHYAGDKYSGEKPQDYAMQLNLGFDVRRGGAQDRGAGPQMTISTVYSPDPAIPSHEFFRVFDNSNNVLKEVFSKTGMVEGNPYMRSQDTLGTNAQILPGDYRKASNYYRVEENPLRQDVASYQMHARDTDNVLSAIETVRASYESQLQNPQGRAEAVRESRTGDGSRTR